MLGRWQSSALCANEGCDAAAEMLVLIGFWHTLFLSHHFSLIASPDSPCVAIFP